MLGSFDYRAPERFTGAPGDLTVDVYALAAVLHVLLAGSKPFPGLDAVGLMHAHLYVAVPVPSVRRPGVPRALDAVIARGMDKDPARRYPSAGALRSPLGRRSSR